MPDPPGRTDLQDLLALSTSVDRTWVQGPEMGLMLAAAAGVVRCRRLARAVSVLLDAELDQEAEALNRVLLESSMTLAWMLASRPVERLDRLRLSDLDERLRSVGGLEQVASTDEDREDLAALRADFESQRDALIDHGVSRAPDLFQRMKELSAEAGVDYTSAYQLAYRQGSRSHIHHNLSALEPFIVGQDGEGRILIDACGKDTRAETQPYETAAIWLTLALTAVALRSPTSFPWKGKVDEIHDRLMAAVLSRREGTTGADPSPCGD